MYNLKRFSIMGSQISLLVFSRMISILGGGNISAGNYVLEDISRKRGGVLAFLITMFISDYFIGGLSLWDGCMLYLCHLLVAGFYLWSGKSDGFQGQLKTVWTGSFIFYLTSNFGVYVSGLLYTVDFEGFLKCYIMGLPFLVRPLLADLFFVSLQHSGSFARVWRESEFRLERSQA